MRSDRAYVELFSEFPELLTEGINWHKEIYSHFGLLFSRYALLEAALQNCYVFQNLRLQFESGSVPDQARWEAAYDLLEKKAFSQTLGNLIRLVEKYPEFEDLIQDLQRLKSKRDYFAHYFFREENGNLLFEDRILPLIASMNELRKSVKVTELRCQTISEDMIARIVPSLADRGRLSTELSKIMTEAHASFAEQPMKFGWEKG